MRDYGKVYSRFWDSRDMRALSEDGRMLALYLMTCKHCTLAGIFRLPDGYVCEDMQWSVERVSKGLAELFRKGFATRCEATKWVWITKHLEWNGLENPNQAKAAAKILAEVENECCWLVDFKTVLADFIDSHRNRRGTVSKPSPNPSATVSKPVSVSVSESVSESVSVTVAVPVRHDATGEDAGGEHTAACGEHSKLNGNGADHPEPKGFAVLRDLYPARSGSQRWADALENYNSNLKAGYSTQQMLDGVMRYARYCKAEEILGQAKVQQAATFLGPNLGFLEEWKPSEKRETAGERWAREGATNARN